MREILFKAKRIKNGKWIEGYYFYNPNIDKHFIHNWLSNGLVEVDKNTICQYTGLTDKNGDKIWENDIVRFQFDNDDCPFPNKDIKKRIGKVFFSDFKLCLFAK